MVEVITEEPRIVVASFNVIRCEIQSVAHVLTFGNQGPYVIVH